MRVQNISRNTIINCIVIIDLRDTVYSVDKDLFYKRTLNMVTRKGKDPCRVTTSPLKSEEWRVWLYLASKGEETVFRRWRRVGKKHGGWRGA